MTEKAIQKVLVERRESDQAERLKNVHFANLRAQDLTDPREKNERAGDDFAQEKAAPGREIGNFFEWIGVIFAAVAALVILISLAAMR